MPAASFWRPAPRKVLATAESVHVTAGRVDLDALLGEGRAITTDDVRELDDACKAILPAQIEVDESADPKEEAHRLAKLVKVLQLGYEHMAYDLEEENAVLFERLESSQDKTKLSIDDEEVERLYEDLRAVNDELKDAYVALDERDELVQNLRVELEKRELEIPDNEIGRAVEAVESELYEERTKKERLEKELQEVEELLQKQREGQEQLQKDLTAERARANEYEGKVRSLDDDIVELRAQLAAEQKKIGNQNKDERGTAEQPIKAKRELDRLLRENRHLETSITETRNKNSDLTNEIMQSSEQVVVLDEERQALKAHEDENLKRIADLEDSEATLTQELEKAHNELNRKIDLLTQFEERFAKQYYDWEEQQNVLKKQVDAAVQERDSFALELSRATNRDVLVSGEPGNGEAAMIKTPQIRSGLDVRNMQRQLVEAEDRVAILCEAYEDLEKANEKDIEEAIAKEKKLIADLKEEIELRERHLLAERKRSKQTDDYLAEAQKQLEDAHDQIIKYEQGYGLQDAMKDVKKLKRDLRDRDERIANLVRRLNKADTDVEDLYLRNKELKRIGGLPDDADSKTDFKLRNRVENVQLRALNSQLEQEVGELEEERRKLRQELRFRAKWQGEHAAKLGLSAAQLSLLEEYADAMRFGDHEAAPRESRAVLQLEEQIKQLQERLANSGTTPSQYDAIEMERRMLETPGSVPTRVLHEQLSTTALQNRKMIDTIHSLKLQVRHLAQTNDKVRSTVLTALESIKNKDAKDAQPEMREMSASEKVQLLQSLLDTLSAEAPVAHTEGSVATTPAAIAAEHVSVAMEMELRQQVLDLSQELARQSLVINEHEGRMQLLARDRERTPFSTHSEAPSSDDPSPRRLGSITGVMLPEDMQALSEELLKCLEQLELKDGQLRSVTYDMETYRVRMQEMLDSRNLLYREHLRMKTDFKSQKDGAQSQIRHLENRVEELKATVVGHEKTIENVISASESPSSEVVVKLKSSMMRETVLKVKELQLARALESALSTETHLMSAKQELENDMMGMSLSMRKRLVEMERGKADSDRRVADLNYKLQNVVASEHHNILVEEHTALQRAFRSLVEDQAESAETYVKHTKVKEQSVVLETENQKLVGQISGLEHQNEALQKAVSEAQAELLEKGSGNSSFVALQEELTSLRVKEANSSRRSDLANKEIERLRTTQSELEARTHELEKQTTDLSRQLHAAQEAERGIARRLEDSIPKEKSERLKHEVKALQEKLSKTQDELEDAKIKAEESEVKELNALKNRIIRQQEVNDLRSALRDIEQSSDLKAVCGRIHEELISVKARESAARHQLESFQLYADRLSDENVHLRSIMNTKEQELSELQDETQMVIAEQRGVISRLEGSLYGYIDPKKAKIWAKSLKELKEQNKNLQAAADSARERAMELEVEVDTVSLKLKSQKFIEDLLNDTVPEAYAKNIRLAEQVLQLQVTENRLKREAIAFGEKAELLEKQAKAREAAIAELEEDKLRMLSKFEQEGTEKERELQQLRLTLKEARSAAASARMQTLEKLKGANQEEMGRLQQAQKIAMAENTQELILQHIEQVKILKLEKADLNLKLTEAVTDLGETQKMLSSVQNERNALIERLTVRAQEQHDSLSDPSHLTEDSAIHSVRRVMELSSARLETRVKEQEETIQSFRDLLAKTRDEAARQQKRDQEEISRLSDSLYDKNSKSIQSMKEDANTPTHISDAVDSMSITQLQALLREREEHISAMQLKLEDAENHVAIAEERAMTEKMARSTEFDQYQTELHQHKSSTSAKLVDSKMASLRAQITEKNKKLRDFSKTIEVLEKKLIEAMKSNADKVMHESDKKLTTSTYQRIKELESQVATLQLKLMSTKTDAKSSQLDEKGAHSELEKLRVDYEKQVKLNEKLSSDIVKDRGTIQDMRKKRMKAIAARTAEKESTEKKLAENDKTIAVLEAQVEKFRLIIQSDEGPSSAQKVRKPMAVSDSNTTRTESKSSSMLSGTPLERWEEEKKMQRRVDILKTKLSESRKELTEAKDKLDKSRKSVDELQQDRAGLQTQIKNLKAEVKRANERRSPGDPRQLQELHAELEQSQEERDRLEKIAMVENVSVIRRLESERDNAIKDLSRNEAAHASGGGENVSHTMEELMKCRERIREMEDEILAIGNESLAVKIEKEQAVGTINRLKSRLNDWFEDSLEKDSPTTRKGSASKKRTKDEKEFEQVVSSLQRVIERQRLENESLKKGIGSNVQYMEVINRNKNLRKKLAEHEELIAKQKKDSQRELQRRVSQMEQTINGLRTQLRRESTPVKTPPEKTAGAEEESNSPLQDLLKEKERALVDLQDIISAQDSKNHSLTAKVGDIRRENHLLLERMSTLEDSLHELRIENKDLRVELNAMDPAFFEEIEDLKHEHHTLRKRCKKYENTLAEWAKELERAPPFETT